MNPIINIGCVANLFSKMMHFKNAGDIELGHTHQFDHLTLLASGSLKVTANGEETIFKAPSMIYIHKDVIHELVALEGNTVAYCIHALRDGNEVDDILDPAMIPNGVNPLSLAKNILNY
jgi:quercetin dioxygenase-like cupin family protein